MPSLGISDIDPYPHDDDNNETTEELLEKSMTPEEQKAQKEAERIWYKDRKPGDYFPT